MKHRVGAWYGVYVWYTKHVTPRTHLPVPAHEVLQRLLCAGLGLVRQQRSRGGGGGGSAIGRVLAAHCEVCCVTFIAI